MGLEGEVIDGKYRIAKVIGEGGMGSVYEGENVRIKRRVAIKVLHAGIAENSEVVQRFEREAQAAGTIGNDHIMEILDIGALPGGERYLVMEFLDGEPLSTRIERSGHLPPAEVAPLVRQMLDGLAAAHGAGIVHRDLKPDNVFILKEKAGTRDYVKIIDFGISKFDELNKETMSLTRTGSVLGTPYYMSPEQASGSRAADSRSDLYAVGVILYEAVTGRVPFDSDTFNQLLFKIVLSEPLSPKAIVPEIDAAFCSIIAKAMGRDVADRFQTAAEFSAALEEWLRTGAAVHVPVSRGTPDLLPASVVVPPGGAQLRRTGGSWASSQHGALVAAPPKSRVPLIAAAVVGGLGLIGGIALGMRALRARPPAAPITVAAAQPDRLPPETAPKDTPPLVTPAPGAAAAAVVADVKPVAPAKPEATVTKKPAVKLAPAKPAPAKPAGRDFGY